MFDVVPIIEEQEVIQLAVMTDRPVRVLIVSLQIAEHHADQHAGQVNSERKRRSQDE
jgi:hypothetical protein